MEPTIASDEYIRTRALAESEDIHRGEVVVYDLPDEPGGQFVKRVVAIPGDVVEVLGTTILVNQTPVPAPDTSQSARPTHSLWATTAAHHSI